jgi:hypothetical protein
MEGTTHGKELRLRPDILPLKMKPPQEQIREFVQACTRMFCILKKQNIEVRKSRQCKMEYGGYALHGFARERIDDLQGKP